MVQSKHVETRNWLFKCLPHMDKSMRGNTSTALRNAMKVGVTFIGPNCRYHCAVTTKERIGIRPSTPKCWMETASCKSGCEGGEVQEVLTEMKRLGVDQSKIKSWRVRISVAGEQLQQQSERLALPDLVLRTE
jgi:hypothetical protein